jgi:hypothetical protein
VADHRIPDVHNPVEESAWEGGGRAGLDNYRGHRYEEHNEEQLALSDEEIEDKRRPAPGHSAITPGASGPSTREADTAAGGTASDVGKIEAAGPIKGIPNPEP